MAHSIEETFKAIKPKGRKGIPNPPTIGVSVSSNNSDPGTSLSQAGQQIAQLQQAYQQQASLISANTQAIQSNTSAQSSHSTLSTVGSAASSVLGGFGLLSPLISGIASLFHHSSTPAPLPVYIPPSPVAINATLNSAASSAASPVTPNATATAAASTSQAQSASAASSDRAGGARDGECERDGQPVIHGPQQRYCECGARGDVEYAPD